MRRVESVESHPLRTLKWSLAGLEKEFRHMTSAKEGYESKLAECERELCRIDDDMQDTIEAIQREKG